MFLFFKSQNEEKNEIAKIEKCLNDWQPLKVKKSPIESKTIVNIGGLTIFVILGGYLLNKFIGGLKGEIESAKNKLDENLKKLKTQIKFDKNKKEFSIQKGKNELCILKNIDGLNFICTNYFENKYDQVKKFSNEKNKNIETSLSHQIYNQIKEHLTLLHNTVKENADNIEIIIEKLKEGSDNEKEKKTKEFLENLNYLLNFNMDLSGILIFLFNYEKIKAENTANKQDLEKKKKDQKKYNEKNKSLIEINTANEKESENFENCEKIWQDFGESIIDKDHILFGELGSNIIKILETVNNANFLQSRIPIYYKPIFISIEESLFSFYRHISN